MTLNEHLERGECYLVYSPRRAWLATKESALLTEPRPPGLTILGVRGLWGNYRRLVGYDHREFNTTDIASLAAVDPEAIRAWDRQKILSPSVKPRNPRGGTGSAGIYSYTDAFAGHVIGYLSRHHTPLATCRHVAKLLSDLDCDFPTLTAKPREAKCT